MVFDEKNQTYYPIQEVRKMNVSVIGDNKDSSESEEEDD